MWRLAPVVLVLACNNHGEHEVTASAAAMPLRVEHLPVVPLSANIREVAATEAGDAALTIDERGGVRLWPALDGSREPVEISAPAAVQIALSRSGSDLIAAVLDQAGSAQLLRVDRDGGVRSRTQIGGEISITRLVAIDDGMLAQRVDQTIVQLDGTGHVRATLATDPGERIVRVVARHGAVLAVIEGDDGTATSARWIEPGLVWGARVTLPAAIVPETVALSPSHRRLAAAEATSRHLFVYDLLAQQALATTAGMAVGPNETIGFIDDDHLAALAPLRWWTVSTAPETSPTTPPNLSSATPGAGAVVDGRVIDAHGVMLALATPQRTRYLGWADLAPTGAAIAGDALAVTMPSRRYVWLDSSLAEQRAIDLPENILPKMPLDDRHLVAEQVLTNGATQFVLVDADHPDHPVVIDAGAGIVAMAWEPSSQMLAIQSNNLMRRYRIDLVHDAAVRLADVSLPGEWPYFRLVDPAQNGAFALVAKVDDQGTRIEQLRDVAGKVVQTTDRVVPGVVFAIGDRGTVVTRVGGVAVVIRGERTVQWITDADVVLDHGSGHVASYDATTVKVYDRDGRESWRVPVWSINQALFTADDRQLLVHGPGGVALFDVATGQRLATGCAWRFGIYDDPPKASAPGEPTLCEDNG
jgi:hypothetical protein